jgi:hypothetical protein
MVEVYRYENPFSLKEYVDLSVEEFRNDFYMGKVSRNTFSEINIKGSCLELGRHSKPIFSKSNWR